MREVAKPVMPECEPVVDERTMAEREVIPEVAGMESDRGTTESGAHSAADSCAMHAHATMHASTHPRRHRTRKHR